MHLINRNLWIAALIAAHSGVIADAQLSTPNSLPPQGARILDVEISGQSSGRVFEAVSIEEALSVQSTPVEVRFKTIHSLGSQLSEHEISQLLEYLAAQPSKVRLRPEIRYALANDVINVLRAQKVIPPKLVDALREIYRVKSNDSVLRDYAVQHLAALLSDVKNLNPDTRNEIEGVLWEAVSETTQSLSGTALLALVDEIRDKTPSTITRRVLSSAIKLAADDNAPLSCRVTALSVASRIHDSEELVPIARLALKGTESIVLKVAALSALGSSTELQDHLYLRDIAARGDPLLANAARQALSRSLPATP